MTDIFSTKGRMSSRDYFSVSIALKALLVGFIYGTFSEDPRVVVLLGLGSVPLLVIIFLFTIKRLHDINRSGWYSILIIVAPLNLAIIPYLWFKTGDKGTNQYGKNPYALD